MPDIDRLAVLVAAGVLVACGGGPAAVSPAEIPELASRVAEDPDNGSLVLRYSAALFAANRCDTAVTVARSGMALSPANAVGPLVVGQCQERQGNVQEALATYRAFTASQPDARGVAAVRARERLTARTAYAAQARRALQQEAQLSAATADPTTVAVLPLQISGDSSFQPLSRGLAQILTSDLALLERFRMVERLQLGALLDEMQFQQGGRVDPSTTARVGRLMQAGRMVQGLVAIPDEDNVRLEATVVLATGEVTSPGSVDGRLRDLLRMEKEIVVSIASQLGYTLSQAERSAILENGTQNLVAFLAYSNGLVAEDLGNFSAAAAYYSQAVQADPGFQAAREGYQSAQATPSVQQASAGQVTTVAAQTVEPPPAADPVSGAIGSTVAELAPTQAEQNAADPGTSDPGGAGASAGVVAVTTTTSTPPPPTVVPPATVTGTIRIVFRLP